MVDVESCLTFEARERQLECYEARVNEVLRASEADADANAFSNADTNELEATPASDATVEPESSRSSRRAERREAREAERRRTPSERAIEDLRSDILYAL